MCVSTRTAEVLIPPRYALCRLSEHIIIFVCLFFFLVRCRNCQTPVWTLQVSSRSTQPPERSDDDRHAPRSRVTLPATEQHDPATRVHSSLLRRTSWRKTCEWFLLAVLARTTCNVNGSSDTQTREQRREQTATASITFVRARITVRSSNITKSSPRW